MRNSEWKAVGRIGRALGGAALDLLYPGELYCICCGKLTDSTRIYRLCDGCMDGIKWTGIRTCSKCGKRLSDVNPTDTCFSCREHDHYYDKGYTCAEYGEHERSIIFSLKYDGRTDIAVTIGEIMYDRMTAESGRNGLKAKYDLVLPVPVSRGKKYIRGYNQAGLTAAEFAVRAGLDCDDSILMRVRDTGAMRSLDPDRRRENIRGAFEIRKWRRSEVCGKRILLIDDIYTTGATVDEITRILKESGCAAVDVLTFAAGADVVKA